MSEQAQDGPKLLDTAKLVAGVLVLAMGVAAFYMFPALPIWLRWIIVLATFVIGALISLQSFQGKIFWAFVQASRVELRKVVWPTRDESVQITIVVFAMVLVLSLFFWGLDSMLAMVTRYLTGRGGA